MMSSLGPVGRRGFFTTAFAGILGALAARAVRAVESAADRKLKTDGEILRQRVSQGDPPVEPLDTMIHFRRSDDSSGRAMTHEVLSLTHEEKGRSSYPWTIYAHLDTHHEEGDACVLCARLHKYGPGWSSGLHSEVFAHNRAVALGVNVEMFNDYAGKEATQVIGVNVQSIASSPRPTDVGLQIHGDGGYRRAIAIDSHGETAIDINGRFQTGIDLHGQQLRLGEGGAIALDGAGEVVIRYREGAIEFLKGKDRVAYLRLDGVERAL